MTNEDQLREFLERLVSFIDAVDVKQRSKEMAAIRNGADYMLWLTSGQATPELDDNH